MLDLTSGAYEFQRLVAAGDFYAALGLPEGARKLDVDVAAARLAERAPWLAREVTAVANVLTHPDRRAVYETLHGLRERVLQTLTERLGAEFLGALPAGREQLWKRSCELTRFSPEYSELVVGPKGVETLARRATEWLYEEWVGTHLTVMPTTVEEDHAQAAVREVWTAECRGCGQTLPIPCRRVTAAPAPPERRPPGTPQPPFVRQDYRYVVPPCPHCRTEDNEPAVYEDTYTFPIPAPHRGAVLRGVGREMGKVLFVLRDGPPERSLPADLLDRFYALQQEGTDVTLDEAEEQWRRASVSPRQAGQTQQNDRSWVNILVALALVVGGIIGGLTRLADRPSSGSRTVPPPWSRPQFEWPKYEPPAFDPRLLAPPSGGTTPADSWRADLDAAVREMLGRTEERALRELFELPPGDKPGEAAAEGSRSQSLRQLEEALQHMEAARGHRLADRDPERRTELELAVPLWRNLLEQRPNEPLLQRRLAGALRELGDEHFYAGQWSEAYPVYEEAVATDRRLVESPAGTAMDRLELGLLLGKLGDCSQRLSRPGEVDTLRAEAIAQLEKCLEDLPHLASAQRALALALHRRGQDDLDRGQPEAALADFSKAIQLLPQEAAFHRDRGIAHARLARWDDAVQDFQETTRQTPDAAQAWYYRALSEQRADRQEDYRTTCRLLLEQFAATTDPGAANDAAWACALAPDAVPDWQPCVDLARRAVQAKPEVSAYRNTLGAVLYRAGELEAAIVELEQAVSLRGGDGTLLDQLFLWMACARLGRAEAAEHWRSLATAALTPPADAPPAPQVPWNVQAECQLLQGEAASAGCEPCE